MNTYVRTLLITTLMATSLQQSTQAAETFFGTLTSAVPAIYSYFTSQPVRADGGTASAAAAEGPEALDAYLQQDDFALLTTHLKKTLKKKGDCAGQSLVWLEENWQAMPPLQYILLRHTAHRAQNGDTLKPEEVTRALQATFYFLVHCHIDTLLCMRAVQHINQFCSTSKEADAVRACRWQVLSAMDLQNNLLIMQQDFNNKYPGIVIRVAQKYNILTAHTSSPSTADALFYETILGQATAPLTKNMHAAAWAIAVWRDDRYDYTAIETARSLLGSWAPGNEPGGLIFNGFTTSSHEEKTKTAHTALRHIKSDTLKRWYNNLYESLMQHLTEAASNELFPINSFDTFFSSPVLSIWFNRKAHHIIYPSSTDDTTTSRRDSASLADDMAVTVIDDDDDVDDEDTNQPPTTVNSHEESSLAVPSPNIALAGVTASLSHVLVSTPRTVASKPLHGTFGEAEQLDDDKRGISRTPVQDHMTGGASKATPKLPRKPCGDGTSNEFDSEALETTSDREEEGESDWF
ncbi:hypothetical protein FJ365_02765 [Candidatus Dependentiae bacterium]|nr:hypothetical protein [Candidatus Dependentiae bacterium]